MPRIRFLVTAALLLSSLVAPHADAKAQRQKRKKADPVWQEPEWKLVWATNTYEVYFSPRRVTGASGLLQAWTKRISVGPRVKKKAWFLELKEYDCTARAARSLSWRLYDEEGKLLLTPFSVPWSPRPDSEWEYVAPNTLGEDELKAICNNRPQAMTSRIR